MVIQDLSDFPSIQQLSKSLWKDGEARGAAAFVGAGFSRFANLASSIGSVPPLWPDLQHAMEQQLYPDLSPSDKPQDPLRIAEEYKAMFGDAALCDFIREQVTDSNWTPGPLHTRLMNLPWADVLTTNWDTLLERTEVDVEHPPYDVVRVTADIARAKQPRVIKLHGTLPSGPFIFSEDDYRTYPTKHAAFVNMARQIFLENELCLFGFSGGDPNFLQWSGWVRDHLGGNARRIFLVVLDLPRASRRLLESRNVVPIDLAPLVTGRLGAERYFDAVDALLTFLEEAEPRPAHDWPPEHSFDRPLDLTERLHKDPALAADEALKALKIWQNDRSTYPGWLICPSQARRKLRQHTEAVVLNKAVVQHLKDSDRLSVLSEAAWRYSTSFWDIPEYLYRVMLECFEGAEGGSVEIVDLGLILLRTARESCREDDFSRICLKLTALSKDGSDERAAVRYQQCLKFRDELNLPKMGETVGELAGPDPIWKLREACIRADLGQAETAAKLIADAYLDLTERQQRDRRSLWILSRRAWAHYLRRATELGTVASVKATRRNRTEWPYDYVHAKCDPWEELRELQDAVDEAIKKNQKETFDIKPHFDAGTYTEPRAGVRFVSSTIVPPAYELERLIDEAALPKNVGWVSISASILKRSLELTFDQSKEWYCRLLKIAYDHDEELFDRYLDRVAVAQLKEDVLATLVAKSKTALRHWTPALSRRDSSIAFDRAVREAGIFIEALSRLVVRIEGEGAEEVWGTGEALIKGEAGSIYALLEPLSNLMQRTTEAIAPSQRNRFSWRAMNLPLASEKGFEARLRSWPDPAQFMSGVGFPPVNDPTVSAAKIAHWISVVSSGSELARSEAALRLAVLCDNDLLNAEQRADFGVALYNRVDPTTGLPDKTNMYSFMFLYLPAPAAVSPNELFRKKLLSNAVPVSEGMLISIKNAAFRSDISKSGLTLSHDEGLSLLDRILGWRPETSLEHDWLGAAAITAKRVGREAGPCVHFAIEPILQPEDLTDERTEALIAAIQSARIPSLSQVLPKVVALRPEANENVCEVVLNLMGSSKVEEVSQPQGRSGDGLNSHPKRIQYLLSLFSGYFLRPNSPQTTSCPICSGRSMSSCVEDAC